MKIRNGFVSNSSTSSFLIYGICIEPHEVGIEDINTLISIADEKLWGSYSPWDNEVYIGQSWDQVGDNQTGLQFKQEIEAAIKEVFPDHEFTFKTWDAAYPD